MPSNRELSDTAQALAEKLGVEVSTAGLNNRELADLVNDLQGKFDARAPAELPPPSVFDAPAEVETFATPPRFAELPAMPGASGEPRPAAESKPESYQVAPGHSITSLRGILGPGTAVSAKDFPHGQSTIDHLVSVNVVLKK